MSDILNERERSWCDRLNNLMKERGYNQVSFLKEYKKKYGGGTQANISRWLRVGNKIENGKKIGFPSYETMVKLADFFDVSVGYLTGETDYESFSMEKTCKFMNADEIIMKAIKGIISGKNIGIFGEYSANEYRAVFKYLVTSNSFYNFLEEVQKYADEVYHQKQPNKHFNAVYKSINPEIRELAIQCINYTYAEDDKYGTIDDFKENNIEPIPELLDAIKLLNQAIDDDYYEEEHRKDMIKLSEYELLKIYFNLIQDITKDEHLSSIASKGKNYK